MHADWHFARPLHPMSRFCEPSICRLLRRSRFAVAVAGSRIGVRGPRPAARMGLTLPLSLKLTLTLDRGSGCVSRAPRPVCADFYGGGRGGMGSTARGREPSRGMT